MSMSKSNEPDRPPTLVEAILIVFLLLLFTPMGWIALIIIQSFLKK
jgi:hypothetical protein